MKLCQSSSSFWAGMSGRSKKSWWSFQKDERLDELYFDTLGFSRFKKLASVVALDLTLNHGQASVERGFSQNSNLFQVNMSPNTVTSKRFIKDHMLANNLKSYAITSVSSIMKPFRSARMRYEEYLKLKKGKKSVSEKETQVLQISSDIENLFRKCSTLEQTIKMLDGFYLVY